MHSNLRTSLWYEQSMSWTSHQTPLLRHLPIFFPCRRSFITLRRTAYSAAGTSLSGLEEFVAGLWNPFPWRCTYGC